MIRSLPSRSSRGALIGAVAVVLSATAVALTNPVPVLTGLNAPRGLAVGPAGRLIYGEFNGAVSELIARGQNAGDAQLLNAVPATTVAAPAVGTLGGQIFVLTAQGAPGSGSNTLYRVTNGTVRALADIGAYQVIDPDPYNVTLAPDESNPFGVAPLPDGSVLVSDAAGNDLLRVVFGHVRVNLAYVPLDLLDKPVVVVGRKVDVFVRLVDAVERAHCMSFPSYLGGNATPL